MCVELEKVQNFVPFSCVYKSEHETQRGKWVGWQSYVVCWASQWTKSVTYKSVSGLRRINHVSCADQLWEDDTFFPALHMCRNFLFALGVSNWRINVWTHCDLVFLQGCLRQYLEGQCIRSGRPSPPSWPDLAATQTWSDLPWTGGLTRSLRRLEWPLLLQLRGKGDTQVSVVHVMKRQKNADPTAHLAIIDTRNWRIDIPMNAWKPLTTGKSTF